MPNKPIDVLYVNDFKSFIMNKDDIRAKHIVFSNDILEWELNKLTDKNFHSLRTGAYIIDVK
ncbi:MAG: hypothetical protein HOH13_01180 [Crocinitomicaceae bacterium]|jgi:hypothetical protein|nr:hypothetical protein [Crocinitomicaceae bacterium]